ncbi:MAG: DNA mismatch repair endonuclease MutL [Oscillospiraceae bacterium]|nr:DNA mismatch repair endonuclease MutL [Oscillospiraceae bacterium]
MPKINVLDKAVAELIAAGEVVERPASIVKELVENSIDAGARQITVEISGGGIKLIRVSDDGCGIDAEDVPKAFLRHATSKVAGADDLDAILTLGFRGEALASVAAMAKVELVTKTIDAPEGIAYTIEGGEHIRTAPAGRPTGTTITVSDVFYNTPARMKFLKRDVGEGNAVSAVMEKFALSHPEIAFRFVRDGQVKLTTSGNGGLKAVARSIFGGDTALLEADYILDGAIHVTGLIGAPAASRKSRAYQNFFINRRYVRSRTCAAALEEAFKGKLASGSFPLCVLNLDISAHAVDVNVHPAKIEVRFADERPVYSAVYYAAKSALSSMDRHFAGQTITDGDIKAKSPVNELTLHLPKESLGQQRLTAREFRALFAEKESEEPPNFNRSVKLKSADIDIFVDDVPRSRGGNLPPVKDTPLPPVKGAAPPPVKPEPKPEIEEEPCRLVGEVFGVYIIIERGKELLLADKHAAHERMIYEYLTKNLELGDRQILLSPVAAVLSGEEYTAAAENQSEFERLGFGVEDFGANTILVREVPIELGEQDIPNIIGEIAAKLVKGMRKLTPDVIDRLFYSIACKAALRAGDKNSKEELAEIIRRLAADPEITHCPHGRPVSVHITRREIDKMFGKFS